MRHALVALALLLGSCGSSGPTEIVLVVDTDLAIPDEIDRIDISLSGTSATPTNVVADLTDPGTPDMPLTLTTFSTLGAGDLAVTVVARLMDAEVTRWEARTSFVGGETKMLRAILAARCLDITCEAGETCDEAGCRAVEIASDALPEWPGTAPVLEGPACTPNEEQCNLYDDDCDEMIDEGIDVSADAANCGECGRACPGGESCSGGYCDSERASDLSAGGAHACVVRQGGNVSCWGWNAYGQLGDGGFIDRPFPADVPGVLGATDVSASVAHTCVVAGSEVHCWGDNTNGELGDGTTETRVAPTAVGLSATAVSAGVAHTCALTPTGDVACWGGNGRGQIGNGATEPALTPQMVIVGDPVVSVAAGNVHTCAAFADGRAACWGANGGGQLGLGMAGPDQALPQMVMGIASAVEVVAGRAHTCARLDDGTVACWGSNGRGQVGDGSMSRVPVPTVIGVSSAALGLGAGSAASHTCAVTDVGATCWGANALGQLGDGSTMNAATPVEMSLLEEAPLEVSTGGSGASSAGYTCVLESTGAVRCIGDGGLGQLGHGSFFGSTDTLVEVDLRL